ncbi:MAG: hypothetical protein ABI180_16325 [Microcoleus sp.]
MQQYNKYARLSLRRVGYTPSLKIEGHGQAKILTQGEIELLFNDGLRSRSHALWGLSLHRLPGGRSLFAGSCGYIHHEGECSTHNQLPQTQHQGQTSNPLLRMSNWVK